MLRQIQTINKHILRMPHNIQAGWSNFFTQHLATRYTKLPNHPPSRWFPRFNLWHMGLAKNSVSQSHQIIIIFPTQKKWWDAPFKTHPIILFTGRILMKWLAYTSMISPYYWWDSILCKKWLDTPKDIPNNPPLSSKWVILLVYILYNVGKTIINNPFGLGIYHLFMVIWGMVKLLFYPHCINISPLGGSPQSQVGKVNLFQ
jgi:hypothetical protein